MFGERRWVGKLSGYTVIVANSMGSFMMSTWESLVWSWDPPESRDFRNESTSTWSSESSENGQTSHIVNHGFFFAVPHRAIVSWKANSQQPGSHWGEFDMSHTSLFTIPPHPHPISCVRHVRPLRAVRVNNIHTVNTWSNPHNTAVQQYRMMICLLSAGVTARAFKAPSTVRHFLPDRNYAQRSLSYYGLCSLKTVV